MNVNWNHLYWKNSWERIFFFWRKTKLTFLTIWINCQTKSQRVFKKKWIYIYKFEPIFQFSLNKTITKLELLESTRLFGSCDQLIEISFCEYLPNFTRLLSNSDFAVYIWEVILRLKSGCYIIQLESLSDYSHLP